MSENVKVKPLVWSDGYGFSHAQSALGRYHVSRNVGGGYSAFFSDSHKPNITGNAKTKVAGRKECQSDYERRVLELLA